MTSTLLPRSNPAFRMSLCCTLAVEKEALLLTADKDFGELVFRLRKANTGVTSIRLSGLSSDEKATVVAGVFDEHQDELAGAFSVISKTTLRIRRGGPSGRAQQEGR